jgi:hypothetical protein
VLLTATSIVFLPLNALVVPTRCSVVIATMNRLLSGS